MTMKGPKWDQVHKGLLDGTVVKRGYASGNYRAENGKSTIDIECPFCRTDVRAYVWSLHGAGKRCTCGALFGGCFGQAYHFAGAIS